MFNNPGYTLADQIRGLVALFCKVMAAEASPVRFGALSVVLWNRVRKLERRLLALYAMWTAGTLPMARVRAPSSPRLVRSAAQSPRRGEGAAGGAGFDPMAGGGAGVTQAPPAGLLPRGLRWMQGLLPRSAGTLASGVDALLHNHPEIRGFVAECPQAGRVLRPLCRLVGLRGPAWLALPRRVRKTDTSPQPSPHSGEGAGLSVRRRRTAREVAAAAIERSNRTGKPIDPRRMSAVAYGYVLHWPRDGTCPPPEIGYGGRSFTPLPKDYVRPKDQE